MSKSSDIRIRNVELDFEAYPYRTPLKFGGVVTNALQTDERNHRR